MTKTMKKAVKTTAQTAVKARKAVRHSRRVYKGDRVGQIVAILATVMAGGYVVLRVIGWLRFGGV